mmetsp:Transcript_7590/g.18303  ORF Transcript_7590/g.18303 Transcript_7590/m.18303 type:complete len:1593 (-) Transcript_7590:572-5350(-)
MPQTRDELLGDKPGPFARHNKQTFSPMKVRPKTANQPLRQMGESAICVYAGRAMSVLKAEAKVREYSEPAKAFFVRLERVAKAELEKLFVLKMQHLFVRNPVRTDFLLKTEDSYPGKPVSFSDLLPGRQGQGSTALQSELGLGGSASAGNLHAGSEILGRSNAMYQGKQLTNYFQGVLAKVLLDFAQFSDALLNYTTAEEKDFKWGSSGNSTSNKESDANSEYDTGSSSNAGSSSGQKEGGSSQEDNEANAAELVGKRFKKIFPEKANILVRRLEELSDQVTRLEQKNYLITDKFQHARRSYLREQILWQEKWTKVRNLIPDALRTDFERLDSEVQIYDDEMYSDESKIHNMYRKQIAEMEEHYTDQIEKLRTRCAFLEDDLAAARNENEKLLFQLQQMQMSKRSGGADQKEEFEGSMDPVLKCDVATRMLKSDFLEFFDERGVDPIPELVTQYEDAILKARGGGGGGASRASRRSVAGGVPDGRSSGTDSLGQDDSSEEEPAAYSKQMSFKRKQTSLNENVVTSRQLRAMGSMALKRQNTTAPSGLSRMSTVFGAILEDEVGAQLPPLESIQIGATVIRGPDWDSDERGDEDLIPGNLGKIVSFDETTKVAEVEWEPVSVDCDEAVPVDLLDKPQVNQLMDLLRAIGLKGASAATKDPMIAIKKAKKMGCELHRLEPFGLESAGGGKWTFKPHKLEYEKFSEERALQIAGLSEMLEDEFGGNFLVLVRWLGDQLPEDMLSAYFLLQRVSLKSTDWWFVKTRGGQKTLRSQKSTKIIMDEDHFGEVTILSVDAGCQVEDDLPGFIGDGGSASGSASASRQQSNSPRGSSVAASGFASERRGTVRMSAGGMWTDLETALDELVTEVDAAEGRLAGNGPAPPPPAGGSGDRSLLAFKTRWNSFVDERDRTVTDLAKILNEPAPKWVSFQDVRKDAGLADLGQGQDGLSPTGSSPRVPLSPGRPVPQGSSRRMKSTQEANAKDGVYSPAQSPGRSPTSSQSPRPRIAPPASRESSPATPSNLAGKKSLLRLAKWSSTLGGQDVGVLEALLNQNVDLEEPLSKKRLRATFRKAGLPLEKEELEELLLIQNIAMQGREQEVPQTAGGRPHSAGGSVRLCDIFDSLHRCLFGAPRRRMLLQPTMPSRPASGSPRRGHGSGSGSPRRVGGGATVGHHHTSASPRQRSGSPGTVSQLGPHSARVDLSMPDFATTKERMRCANGEGTFAVELHPTSTKAASASKDPLRGTSPFASGNEKYWSDKAASGQHQQVQLPRFQFAPTRTGAAGGLSASSSSSAAQSGRKRSHSPRNQKQVHASVLPEEYLQAQARLTAAQGQRASSPQNRQVLSYRDSVDGKRPHSSMTYSGRAGPGTTGEGLVSVEQVRRPIFASKDYVPPPPAGVTYVGTMPGGGAGSSASSNASPHKKQHRPGTSPPRNQLKTPEMLAQHGNSKGASNGRYLPAPNLSPALTMGALRIAGGGGGPHGGENIVESSSASHSGSLAGAGGRVTLAFENTTGITMKNFSGPGSGQQQQAAPASAGRGTTSGSAANPNVQVPGKLFKSPSHVNMRAKSREAMRHPKDSGALARASYMPDAWYEKKK